MADVILHGLPPSTYVRTARMVAAHKGVPYRLEPVDFRSDAYRAMHPFGKIPAMTHGDVHLFEVLAIASYLDDSFDGPDILPKDPKTRALALQWVSATADYGYERLIRSCVIERITKPWRGLETDEAKVVAARPLMKEYLDAVEAGLTSDYLAGDAVSLADLTLAPILVYFATTPEGQDMLPQCPRLQAWRTRMEAMPDYAEINAMG